MWSISQMINQRRLAHKRERDIEGQAGTGGEHVRSHGEESEKFCTGLQGRLRGVVVMGVAEDQGSEAQQ